MGQSLDHGPGPVWRLDVLWSVGMGQATKDQLNEGRRNWMVAAVIINYDWGKGEGQGIRGGFKVKNPPNRGRIFYAVGFGQIFLPNHNYFSKGKVVLTRVCEYKVIF